MKTKSYNVYEFNELSKEAKDRAIEEWYENEDYPLLEDELTELAKDSLQQAKIEYSDLKLLYSLSYCQGDGLTMTGKFYIGKRKKLVHVTHRYNYMYCGSESMDFDETMTENEIENFKNKFREICYDLQRAGYAEIEYRMNYDEFAELCESNGYTFRENGIMDNIKD